MPFVVEMERFSDNAEVVRAGKVMIENGLRVAIQGGGVSVSTSLYIHQYRVRNCSRRFSCAVGDAIIKAELYCAEAKFRPKASLSVAITSRNRAGREAGATLCASVRSA
ncbi:hypothetical protein [Propionivibrio sp.]|uniref:hypothetical protein n=1 Tax=Propionivibrio sp. TaxID=2212460 RepID=UPI003BF4CD35